jgi:DNA-binding MarR family transcriptional regulator
MSKLPPDRVTTLCAAAVAECACERLRRAARAVTKFYEGALAGLGLTATQFAILAATRLRGPIPLSRLAEGLTLDRTSLYRAVQPLDRRGYLRILPGRTARERMATLTAKGERLLQEALPIWDTTQRRFVGALGTRTWAALSSGATQVVPAVRALESGAAAPARQVRRRAPAPG